MTQIQNSEIQCDMCDGVSNYEFYSTVNVTLDPGLKDAILDGSIYQRKCPKCDNHFDVQPDMLYHDMRQRVCVWLKNLDESGVPKLEPGTEVFAQGLPGYTTRIVSGRNELLEKIKLADDGHNDIVIELAKLFFSINNKIDLTSMFYYDRMNKKLFGKKTLVFTRLFDDSSAREYNVDFTLACKSAEPITAKITDALKTRWGPWMWVTRATILTALEDSGLARKL